MKPQHLLLSLGWLLLISGCTAVPESVPTAPPTRVVSETATPATVLPANTPLAAAVTATLLPNSTSAPIEAPMLPAAAVRQTQAALIAVYTSIPSKPPAPTPTSFTRTIWRILFNAVPCPADVIACDNALFMEESSRWYLINSDGSGLIALEDTGTFLSNMWGYPHPSPDGTYLAYLARSETNNELHIMLAEISSGNVSDLGIAPDVFQELKFLSESGCLAVYSSPRLNDAPAIEIVTVTKVCAGSDERQLLETIELPGLRPAMNLYRLSPQGDAFLITTLNESSIPEAYVYEFGSQQPPRLLLSGEDATWFIGGPARWRPDGQEIEIFLQHLEPDNMMRILLYTSDRQGNNRRITLELKLPFSLQGDWSPDGRELAFFPGMPEYTPETTGIYILDLETGTWRQILSGFYKDTPLIQSWQATLP
ncbi:MAG: hypothetical protein KF770_32340 [Anaerolineae bacterium]|nr:hypothetical protein [Anaerolineae bacterium]